MRTMRHAMLLILGLTLSSASRAQPAASDTIWQPTPAEQESLARAYTSAVRRLTTPEVYERLVVRRSVQRRGYAFVLRETVTHDAFGALLAYIRLMLHIEYWLPHNMLTYYPPRTHTPSPSSFLDTTRDQRPRFPIFSYHSSPEGYPLTEDWTFPADPWKRKAGEESPP